MLCLRHLGAWSSLVLVVACGGDSKNPLGAHASSHDAGGAQLGSGGGPITQTDAQGNGGAATGSGGDTGSGGATTGSGGADQPASSGGSATAADSGSSSDASTEGGGAAGTCSSDGDCGAPDRFCDTTHGVCVECLSDMNCPQGETCGSSDHRCKFACATSGDCKDPLPYCDTRRGACVQCLGDANCSTGSKHVCESTTRTCVECAASADCSCLLLGQVPCCTKNNQCTCGLLLCL